MYTGVISQAVDLMVNVHWCHQSGGRSIGECTSTVVMPLTPFRLISCDKAGIRVILISQVAIALV